LPDTALSRPVDDLDEQEARRWTGRWQSVSTPTRNCCFGKTPSKHWPSINLDGG
jgi:hypothetical protein